MGKWLAILASLAIAAVPLPAVAADDAHEIRVLSDQWMQAIERKDRQTLDRILAPEFSLRTPGTAESEAVGRSEWIDNATNRDWSKFRYENWKVDVDGDRALATSTLAFKVSPMPFVLDSGVVDHWVKRDGRWQIRTRWLGNSAVMNRLTFFGGILAGLLLAGLIALLVRWRRQRKVVARA